MDRNKNIHRAWFKFLFQTFNFQWETRGTKLKTIKTKDKS